MPVDEIATGCGGYRECEPNFTSALSSSHLLRDDVNTLLECVTHCWVLRHAIDNEDVDEVRKRAVGKVTLEVTRRHQKESLCWTTLCEDVGCGTTLLLCISREWWSVSV